MSGTVIDPTLFKKRSEKLLQIISKSSEFDVMSIPIGRYDQNVVTKSATLFNYLFGVEVRRRRLYFLPPISFSLSTQNRRIIYTHKQNNKSVHGHDTCTDRIGDSYFLVQEENREIFQARSFQGVECEVSYHIQEGSGK